MKYLLRLLFLFSVSGMMVTCEDETYPFMDTTTELIFGVVTTEQTFSIYNSGTGTLTWNISENLTWLETDKTNGYAEEDKASEVTATINREGLEPGIYNGNMVLTGDNNSITIAVTIWVTLLGTFTDSRDNHEYQWIQIGDQIWMRENLAWLPKVSPPEEGSFTEPRYFVYDYFGTNVTEAITTENYSTYGALYNWPAALQACPEGWHLPTIDEWEKLAQYAESNLGLSFSSRWETEDYYGNPIIHYSGGFGIIGFSYILEYTPNRSGQVNWWSATEFLNHDDKAWETGFIIYYNSIGFRMTTANKDRLYRVRCIKN